jgi:hypothetical protein
MAGGRQRLARAVERRLDVDAGPGNLNDLLSVSVEGMAGICGQ